MNEHNKTENPGNFERKDLKIEYSSSNHVVKIKGCERLLQTLLLIGLRKQKNDDILISTVYSAV